MPEITPEQLARFEAAEEVANALNIMLSLGGFAGKGNPFDDRHVREHIAKPLQAWADLRWPEEAAEEREAMQLLFDHISDGADGPRMEDGAIVWPRVGPGYRERDVRILVVEYA